MFALRFDIDSNFGLTRRLEPLLALLRQFGINVTFFCVMGRDASLAEILRLRIFGRGQAAPDGRAMGMPNLRVPPNLPKILYTLAFPRRVGHGHPRILRELVAAGLLRTRRSLSDMAV